MKEAEEIKPINSRPRILIIEDEARMVDFIKLGLEYEGFEVEDATDGKTGLKMALDRSPDLIILDLMLPGMNGFEVCQRLRKTHDIPVIMLTARDELNDRVQGLDIGADDYLTKPFQFKELVARIRAVLRRKPASNGNFTPGQTETRPLTVYDLTLDPGLRELRRGTQIIEFSQREFDLLKLLMSHPNQVLNRETILEKVWGYDFNGDYNIIEVYIRYLRQKLGEPNLIYTVRGVGYVLRSRPKEKEEAISREKAHD
ncbi:MAG TPA: response regulator transcription factor [Chloroflexia bacterium]|nr:response regulator transcription factor [Chloroflexia bacterium]